MPTANMERGLEDIGVPIELQKVKNTMLVQSVPGIPIEQILGLDFFRLLKMDIF